MDRTGKPSSGPAGRAMCRGLARMALLLVLAVPCGAVRTARGQDAPWGWGFPRGAAASWTPEHLADYLLTGQTPHPAVVRIIAAEPSGTSMGSGVLVDVNRTQGLVLTNWHVVRESHSAVLVQFPDGFQSAGTVVRWDEAWDLAAIVIWRPAATPVPLAAAPPQPGQPLTIAGFGRGAYREQSGECTEYLSPGTGYPKEFVELKAAARQGDSGGPIFNDRRELAGVLFGQNEGRTVGSCSTRVRAFLGQVGSPGFTPAPTGQFADVATAESETGGAAGADVRLAVTPVAAVVEQPTNGFVAKPPAGVAEHTPPPSLVGPGAARPATPPAWSPLAGLGLPPWIPDPFVHGSTWLAGAGGLALIVAGLRTVFGGRRA